MNASRQPRGLPVGGQFATTSHAESAATLGDSAEDRREAIVARIAIELRGGRAVAHDSDGLTYEDSGGNSYTIRIRELARGEQVYVSPDDSDGYPMTATRTSELDGRLSEADIADAVAESVWRAHKRRAFVAALGSFFAATNGEVSVDADEGRYRFYSPGHPQNVAISVHGFQPSRPETDDRVDALSFVLRDHEPEHDAGQYFEVRRHDDRIEYVDEQGSRLATWQVNALEQEIARRGGPSVAALLNKAVHEGDQRMRADRGAGR